MHVLAHEAEISATKVLEAFWIFAKKLSKNEESPLLTSGFLPFAPKCEL